MATVPQQLTVEPKTQVSAPLGEIRNAIMPGISLHLFCELSEVRSYAEYAGLQTANMHYSTHTVLSQLSGKWKLQLTTKQTVNLGSQSSDARSRQIKSPSPPENYSINDCPSE